MQTQHAIKVQCPPNSPMRTRQASPFYQSKSQLRRRSPSQWAASGSWAANLVHRHAHVCLAPGFPLGELHPHYCISQTSASKQLISTKISARARLKGLAWSIRPAALSLSRVRDYEI